MLVTTGTCVVRVVTWKGGGGFDQGRTQLGSAVGNIGS